MNQSQNQWKSNRYNRRGGPPARSRRQATSSQDLPASRDSEPVASVPHPNRWTQPVPQGQTQPPILNPKPRPQKKPVHEGPKLPPFKWFTSFPQAQLYYLYHPEQALDFLPRFKQSLFLSDPVIGFDIEWKPNFIKGQPENPVALIQLASRDAVVLLHISRWNWSSSITFRAIDLMKEILHDPRIKKLGVNISDDGKKLHRDTRTDMHGCIDLSKFARLIDLGSWDKPGPIGLARLSANYLQLDLDKVKKIVRSNWESPLSEEQILYAANDAAVALAIYYKVKLLVKAASPPSVSKYEFNVIEGAFKELSVAAIAAAQPIVPQLPSAAPAVEDEGFVLQTGYAVLEEEGAVIHRTGFAMAI